jgi:S-DNA-T family DNA segregation ATPase FtsK/SpoIIIE
VITEGTTVVKGGRTRSRNGEEEGVGKRIAKSIEASGGRDRGGLLTSEADPGLIWKRVAWIAGLLAFVFITLSLGSFSATDPGSAAVPVNQPPANLGGLVGALVAHYLFFSLWGWGAWVLVALFGVALYVWGNGYRITHLAVRVLGALMLAATAACAQAIYFPGTGPVTGLPGGYIGVAGGAVLSTAFNALAIVPLILALVIGAIVTLDVWAMLAAAWTGRVLWNSTRTCGRVAGAACLATARTLAEKRAAAKEAAAQAAKVRQTDVDDDKALVEVAREAGTAGIKKGKKKAKAAEGGEKIDPDAGGIGGIEQFDPDGSGLTPAAARGVDEDDDESDDDEGTEPSGSSDGDDDDEGEDTASAAPAPQEPKAEEKRTFTPEELRAKMAKLPVRFASQTKRSATEADLRDIQNTQDLEGYRFPGLDLLEEPEGNFVQTMESYIREQAEALEKALKEYRIDGEVVGVESGPVITMYELRLAPGTKVAALSAVASDLARALKSVNIRIVTNIAGRDTVGVEVPNAQKEKVRLKELMTKAEVYGGMRLPMFLGKDASGEPMIEDLSKMPHMLIAGTTGSGKSVCMNTIIMSFLYTKKPNELKLVLVDPKMVEMSQFKDIPHLMCPVVTEMSKAAAILEWAVNKMDERYELLAEAGCRDIASYNEMTWEELKDRFNPSTPEEEAKIPRKLPYMVFVIDELADLMMTNKEVEHSIVRIAQKARAVGMHLILATQRPQANVVTGLIKSNMPARIAFKVASGMDSRIVLDQKGGELLLGQGDMLYLSPKSSKLTRAQGTLVDDKEIRRVVKFMREVAQPTFERSLMQLRSAPAGGPGGAGDDPEADKQSLENAQDDPMFDKAVEVVIETRRGSVSMLQRRLAIGYTRASRLIDAMGLAGIVGEHKGTVEREVMITLEEWQAMKAQAAADAAAAEEADKHLPSKPIADTLEQAQSIVNDGNLKENLESQSKAKATEELEDEEEVDDDGELDADQEGEDAPPFDVQVRAKRPGVNNP